MEQSQLAFMVVGQTGIVLQDIMASLAGLFPDWQGRSAANMTAALTQLNDDAVRIALITAAPDEFADSDLAVRLDEIGARVVLMGDGAEEFGACGPYPVLHRPFISDDLAAIVRADA